MLQLSALRDVESISISPRTILKSTDSSQVREYRPETDPTILVQRYCLPTQAEPIPDNGLCQAEVDVFSKAFKYLESANSAEKFICESNKYESPNNIVIVDVITRHSKEGIIKPKDNIQIRTICLWKKCDDRFVLIDPLSSNDTQYFQRLLQMHFPANIEINKCSKDGIFYRLPSYSHTVGVKENDFRDDIDLAVKIAFKLNEEQMLATPSCSLEEIQKSIISLSNQSQVNKVLGKTDCVAVRELQSSNPATRELYFGVFEKCKNYLCLDELKIDTTSKLLKLKELTNNADFIGAFEEYKKAKQNAETQDNPNDLQTKLETLLQKFPEVKIQPNYADENDLNDLFRMAHANKVTKDNEYTALHLAIHRGNTETAKQLLEAYPKLASAWDIYGQTPLHWVASQNHVEENKWLEVLGLLMSKMDDEAINKATKDSGYTALHLAVHCGNTKMIKRLIAGFVVPFFGSTSFSAAWISEEKRLQHKRLGKARPCIASVADVHGQTALHWVAGKNHSEEDKWLETLELLIRAMSPMRSRPIEQVTKANGSTALHFAIHCGNTKMVATLIIGCPTLVSIPDKHGQTPLHWVVGKSHSEEEQWLPILDLLMNNMSQEAIQKKKTEGYTALHLAIHCSNTKMIQNLIQKCRALTSIADVYGQTPLHWVAGKNHSEEEQWLPVLDLLMNNMDEEGIKKVKAEGYTALHLSIHCNNTMMAAKLATKCPALASMADIYGQSPLRWIAEKDPQEEGKWLPIIKLLIPHMDHKGMLESAKQLAEYKGNKEMTTLIQKRIDEIGT
jgi:ankyrin repeat protein